MCSLCDDVGEVGILDDIGAKRLIAAVLKQAYDDYTNTVACPKWCSFYTTCENKENGPKYCDAKKFLHSAWCVTLCEGMDINYEKYLLTALENCRLSKNTYKYIEGELRSFRQAEKELNELKDDITLATPIKQEGHSYTPGDPTQSKTMAILKDKKIQRMQKTVDAIKKVYNRLDNKKRSMVDGFYFTQRYTAEGIACRLQVDKSTVNRWRQRLVYSVAIELNYL
jgi:RinA family phage transcriptional activator